MIIHNHPKHTDADINVCVHKFCLSHVHICTVAKSDTLLPSVYCHRSFPGGLALSSPSRPPVSEPLRQRARQRGDRALRLQCTPPHTVEQHTGWTTEQLAQDCGDGASLGAIQEGEWHKDRQGELMQCLEYQIHWQVLLQTVKASFRVRLEKMSSGIFGVGSSFLRCGLMWSGMILDSSVHRKCIMSGRLWAEFVFGHLCSALASVGCRGLNPDTRSRPGLFSLRTYRGGGRKQRTAQNVLTGNGNGLPMG